MQEKKFLYLLISNIDYHRKYHLLIKNTLESIENYFQKILYQQLIVVVKANEVYLPIDQQQNRLAEDISMSVTIQSLQWMDDQIITEQIDVIVIGDRKLQLVALMLQKELMTEEDKKRHTHEKYLKLLQNLVGDPIIPQSSKNWFGRNTPCKFTKVILTNSFWLHIHFFIQDNKVFDPFVSQACRGNISICIIAASEGTDLTASKAFLLQSNPTKPLQLAKEGGIIRPETIVEAKILSTAHEISLPGFAAVLTLKISGEKRIMQESSNLRLTVNQISRWIVDRHFEVKHRIKINPKLGDEIQYYEEKEEKSFCKLI